MSLFHKIMTLRKLTYYLYQEHQIIDNQSYYLKLSLIIGFVLTIFVYIFDPYDNYLAISKYKIPIKIIQLGYGINTALVIYTLYWLLFQKLGFAREKRTWRIYHHWLLLIAILAIAGFLGTVYHRSMMDVGEVKTSYYMFVTIPRSIIIAVPLFVITILLDQLYTQKKEEPIVEKMISSVDVNQKTPIFDKKIILRSPTINQSLEVIPSKILYIKASGNYVEIYSLGEKKAKLLRASLRFVAECLSQYNFIIKCHRQYYVNIHKVLKHQKKSQRLLLILPETTKQIPVSKSYIKKTLSHLK